MSSDIYISEEHDSTGIPVVCSKCSETFESDTEYVMHYNESHAAIDPD